MVSTETTIARQIARGEQVAAIRARTGGEDMNPDHYDFRMALRDAVLAAMDECAEQHGMTKPKDEDLPALFRCLDPLAEKLWLRRSGL